MYILLNVVWRKKYRKPAQTRTSEKKNMILRAHVCNQKTNKQLKQKSDSIQMLLSFDDVIHV